MRRTPIHSLPAPLRFGRSSPLWRARTDCRCFATAAGAYLRYRCCVYYSALAAALLETRYGGTAAASASTQPYAAMARWLLEPHAAAGQPAAALAAQLQSEPLTDSSYHLAMLRKAAGLLPGPLGRYQTRLAVNGVLGTLWRCEVSTVHTYLVFSTDSSAIQDVFVDVTHKQFLVLPDLMEPRHFEACQHLGLFAERADAFVGTAADLASVMTLPALRTALEAVYMAAGDNVSTSIDVAGDIERGDASTGAAGADGVASPFARLRGLEGMHQLRNEFLFAIDQPSRRRQVCGRPSQ